MASRRVDLEESFAASTSQQQDVRFAGPTGRAKSGRVFVNVHSNSGGTGTIYFQLYTASDVNLDPAVTGSPFWLPVHSPVSYSVGSKGTSTVELTPLGDWLRWGITVPSGNTTQFSIVVFLYDA